MIPTNYESGRKVLMVATLCATIAAFAVMAGWLEGYADYAWSVVYWARGWLG